MSEHRDPPGASGRDTGSPSGGHAASPRPAPDGREPRAPVPIPAQPPEGPPELDQRQLYTALAGVLLSILVAALDQTIVGTALPRVVAELHGFALYSWVVAAYLLTATCVIPIAGKLSDQLGRKPILLIGLVIFVLGSALCGLSQTMPQLVLFRGLQGIGAGALQSGAFASIGDLFPPAERGRWQGVIAATFGIASLIGPTLGGWMTDTIGWRWIFYVNVPVGAVAFATLAFGYPSTARASGRPQIDWPGVAAIVAAIVPLLVGLTWAGTTYPWNSPQVIAPLAFSALMFVVFVLIEARSREPLLPLDLFRNHIFTAAAAASLFLGPLLLGLSIYLPLFVQGVLGRSAGSSGLILTPFTLGSVVTNILGGQLVSRTGRYKRIVLTGAVLTALGVALMIGMGTNTDDLTLIRNMLIAGSGLGFMLPQFTIAVQNALPYSRLGVVTSSIQFTRSIGSTVGVSVLGAIVSGVYASHFAAHESATLRQALAAAAARGIALPTDPSALISPEAQTVIQQVFAQFLGPERGAQLYHEFVSTVQYGLLYAVRDAFIALFSMALLVLLAAFFLKEIPLRRSNRAAPEATNVPAGAARPLPAASR